MKDLLRVIKFQKFCRDTHIEWVDYYKEYPKEEDSIIGKIAGDIEHHQLCINGYDKTLKLLYNLKEDK